MSLYDDELAELLDEAEEAIGRVWPLNATTEHDGGACSGCGASLGSDLAATVPKLTRLAGIELWWCRRCVSEMWRSFGGVPAESA